MSWSVDTYSATISDTDKKKNQLGMAIVIGVFLLLSFIFIRKLVK